MIHNQKALFDTATYCTTLLSLMYFSTPYIVLHHLISYC